MVKTNIDRRVKSSTLPTVLPPQFSETKSSQMLPVIGTQEETVHKLHAINAYLQKYISGEFVPLPEVIEEVENLITESSKRSSSGVSWHTRWVGKKANKSRQENTSQRLGMGLDLGTAYLVAAHEVESRRVFVKNERNVFLKVRSDQITKDFLTKLKVKYASLKDQMYVLGSPALNMASIFNRETQRSMRMGILNSSESESIPIIKFLIEHILWSSRKENEICCFSVPAKPVDSEQDTIYHCSVFKKILEEMGFRTVTIDEGYAVILSELAYKDFTGIGVSCGGGMVNVCVAYKSVPVLSFSITRGGDWIDQSAASALRVPVSHVTTIKEQGISLNSPSSREEEAIAIYYKSFIQYFLEVMAKTLGGNANTPQFKDPIDIVFSGGTSMANDFFDVIKEKMQSIDFGFPIGDVKIAEEPFTSVVRGCLFHAINLEEQET